MTISRMLESLSFCAGLSVIATTGITICLFKEYSKKQLVSNDNSELQTHSEDIDYWWYLGLFAAELYAQFRIEQYLDFGDAIFVTLTNVIGNIVLFFICYGILNALGVDKENKFKKCNKSFIGLVILNWACLLLLDYTNNF